MGFAEAWRKIKTTEEDPVLIQEQEPADPTPRSHEAEGGDWYDDRICEAIDDLAGVRMMTYPEHVRDAARKLFDEFSEAAAQGDDARFWKALMGWRQIWLKSMH